MSHADGGAPDSSVAGRILRLHAFEILIFAVLFVLIAICLAVAPLVAGRPPPRAALSGAPR
jgi:hypothetical protein